MNHLLEEYCLSRKKVMERIGQLTQQRKQEKGLEAHELDRRIRVLREESAELGWVIGEIRRYLGRKRWEE